LNKEKGKEKKIPEKKIVMERGGGGGEQGTESEKDRGVPVAGGGMARTNPQVLSGH